MPQLDNLISKTDILPYKCIVNLADDAPYPGHHYEARSPEKLAKVKIKAATQKLGKLVAG